MGLTGRNSPDSLLRRCRSVWGAGRAKLYNRLVHYYPQLASAVESDAYTRNVLGNRLAAGDVRWLEAPAMVDWQPGCNAWLAGWATCRVTLQALIPYLEAGAAGAAWGGGIPGQLAMLEVEELNAITAALLRLGSIPPEEPGVMEILTALHLVVGWRDRSQIPYAPARRIAEQPDPDPQYLLDSHRWTKPQTQINWALLKLAVLGPEELRLEAADAWAGDWEWRNAVLLGLDLLPAGGYLKKSRTFSYGHCGRAIAWAKRIGKIHWFAPECSACFLLELEHGPSAMAESLIVCCLEGGWLAELREFAAQWLVYPAHQRFQMALGRLESSTQI